MSMVVYMKKEKMIYITLVASSIVIAVLGNIFGVNIANIFGVS